MEENSRRLADRASSSGFRRRHESRPATMVLATRGVFLRSVHGGVSTSSVEKLFVVKSTLKTHSSGSVDLIYRTCSLLKPAFQSDVSVRFRLRKDWRGSR